VFPTSRSNFESRNPVLDFADKRIRNRTFIIYKDCFDRNTDFCEAVAGEKPYAACFLSEAKPLECGSSLPLSKAVASHRTPR
jgi:hypothetical protein